MHFLWGIILAEGFTILAIEVSIMRLLMPYVGSGIEVTSILITAILLPMAYGYDYAGKHVHNMSLEHVRKKLQTNFFIATVFMVFALSYHVVDAFYLLMSYLNIHNHLIITSLYASIFVAYPIFLLAQTLPLISSYFKEMAVQAITGRLLFLSTLGSFLGAVLTSLVLMNWLGVSWSCWIITLVLVIMLSMVSKRDEFMQYYALALSLLFAFMSRDSLMHQLGIVAQTPYSFISVSISPDGEDRMLQINHSASSIASKHHQFKYVQYIENHFLHKNHHSLDVLVLGAGGFSIGSEDLTNRYQFVDIESKLQAIAQQYLLKRPLNPNVTFTPKPAVNFLRDTDIQYDLIIVDMYSNGHTIPAQLVTLEFYDLVKSHLKETGTVVLNTIISPTLQDTYSRRMDNTLRTAFPFVYSVALHPTSDTSNMIYVYQPQGIDHAVYTREKAAPSIDKL